MSLGNDFILIDLIVCIGDKITRRRARTERTISAEASPMQSVLAIRRPYRKYDYVGPGSFDMGD